MILLVDNYDSFTYNLAELFSEDLVILRNDEEQLFKTAKEAEAIVFSPGPGYPKDAGKMEALIRSFYQEKPMLGICLGHQAIGEVFGGKIIQAREIIHGKTSLLEHQRQGLFKKITNQTEVMRYHSLVIEKKTIPDLFEIQGTSDGEIMAIKHREYPIYGLQFHPESIGTPEGRQMIETFIEEVGALR